jgi:membrane carboxypeptidase/penicillin-binding protein
LVRAYAPLANGGLSLEPRTIVRVYDNNRRTWTEIPPVTAPAVSAAVSFVTTRMLQDVMVYGTAKGLKKFSQDRPAAGKTGTTSDYRDAWFVGYTPQLVTGIWVGYDQPRPGGKGFTGGAVAAPIWERFMRPALAGRPAADFTVPEGVAVVTIDPATGFLATPLCPEKQEEVFIAGTEPNAFCPRHGGAPPQPAPPEPAASPAPSMPGGPGGPDNGKDELPAKSN